MRLLRLAAALVVAGTLATTAGGATSPSGLYGIVKKGPTTPVCRQGKPCDAPAQVTLIFRRAGRDMARVRSAATGAFRIALAPGIYAVRTLEKIGIARNIKPANIHVRAGHWDRIDFLIDTGIR